MRRGNAVIGRRAGRPAVPPVPGQTWGGAFEQCPGTQRRTRLADEGDGQGAVAAGAMG